jgi:hypothetical protein
MCLGRRSARGWHLAYNGLASGLHLSDRHYRNVTVNQTSGRHNMTELISIAPLEANFIAQIRALLVLVVGTTLPVMNVSVVLKRSRQYKHLTFPNNGIRVCLFYTTNGESTNCVGLFALVLVAVPTQFVDSPFVV